VYEVKGLFLPNNLSPYDNDNRRLDILRCKMNATHTDYIQLINTEFHVQVDIFKNETEEDILIAQFTLHGRHE